MAPSTTAELPAPKADEALVIFVRPSSVGFAVASSVFDVTDAGPAKLVGIVNSKTKVAYPVQPGERTFMVVSEVADFMKANVVSGKTYYALVTPRMGMWKARFAFRPVRAKELDGDEFKDWNSSTQLVTNTPAALDWYDRNAADIHIKRTSNWAEWSGKAAEERAEQTLNAEDGR